MLCSPRGIFFEIYQMTPQCINRLHTLHSQAYLISDASPSQPYTEVAKKIVYSI